MSNAAVPGMNDLTLDNAYLSGRVSYYPSETFIACRSPLVLCIHLHSELYKSATGNGKRLINDMTKPLGEFTRFKSLLIKNKTYFIKGEFILKVS